MLGFPHPTVGVDHLLVSLRTVIDGIHELRRYRIEDEAVVTVLAVAEESISKIFGRIYVHEMPRRGASPLSPREIEVLRHVAAGESNKQIARKLQLSQTTVRNHLSRIFKKLNAGNRTEAVMTAVRGGLLVV